MPQPQNVPFYGFVSDITIIPSFFSGLERYAQTACGFYATSFDARRQHVSPRHTPDR
jgi:hypothetical protein